MQLTSGHKHNVGHALCQLMHDGASICLNLKHVWSPLQVDDVVNMELKCGTIGMHLLPGLMHGKRYWIMKSPCHTCNVLLGYNSLKIEAYLNASLLCVDMNAQNRCARPAAQSVSLKESGT